MLLWFRNDLRVHDNPAVAYALAHGVTQAVFIATPEEWSKHHMAPIKVDLILRHVALLDAQLKQLGIDLTIIHGSDYNSQIDTILTHLESIQSNQVIVNQELELRERNRDEKLKQLGINIMAFEGDVIVPKGLVRNNSGAMFKVFTPFKKAWLNYVLNNG